MGITERREREKEQVRKRILDAARELFTTHGYDRVTMRAVAQAIEYSPTAIYGHFRDKDDLVHCLCEEDFRHLLKALLVGRAPKGPLATIRRLGQAYARFGLKRPHQYRFLFMATKADHEHERSQAGEQSFSLLQGAVAAAIECGELPPQDPTIAAQVLWSSLHGVVALLVNLPPHCWPDGAPAPDLVDRVIDNTLRGLRRLES